MITRNIRSDTPDNDIKLNSWESKCYRYTLTIADELLLFTWFAKICPSFCAGVFFHGDSNVYVSSENEVNERFEEVLRDLNIDWMLLSQYEKFMKAKTNRQ